MSEMKPRQMEYTVALPDREVQYQKTPVYKKIQKTITHSVNEIATDESGNEISNVNKAPLVDTIEETVLATVDSGALDQGGNPQKQVLNWGDILAPAKIVIPIKEDPLPIKAVLAEPKKLSFFQKIKNFFKRKPKAKAMPLKAGTGKIVNAKKQDALSKALPDTKVTADLVTQLFPEAPEDIDKVIKARGQWGLGCPGNCGYFWSFTYEDMVPQILTCPQCGVHVTLN
jgi:hypothetical protein